MEASTLIGIGILILILISFVFNQISLKDINTKNQQNMNGISHVWGTLMELKLDLQLLENKLLKATSNDSQESVEEMQEVSE